MNNGSIQNGKCLLPIIFGITGHIDLKSDDEEELADRLVVKVFLNLKKELGNEYWKMYVPLPMPAVEYERDLRTQESKSEFYDLIKQADDVIELPYVGGNSEAQICDREVQYEQVGEYIAVKSQILIALWDGYETENIAISNFNTEGIRYHENRG